MQTARRIRATIPYLVALAVTAGLWATTASMTYSARPGQLPPTFWPRLALGLIVLSCLYEIARLLFSANPWQEAGGLTAALDRSEKDAHPENEAPRSPALLLAGIGLTVGYALSVETLGFLLASFLFLVAFMYLGRYRRHLAIWLSASLGILAFAFIFLKVAYVSIPRGTAPFDQVTQAVLNLLGIR
jgi:hypothetical protein